MRKRLNGFTVCFTVMKMAAVSTRGSVGYAFVRNSLSVGEEMRRTKALKFRCGVVAASEVESLVAPVVSDLRWRIEQAPSEVQLDERPELCTHDLDSSIRIEIDGDGNPLEGLQGQRRLALCLQLNTFVVLRVTCIETRATFNRLAAAAQRLLRPECTANDKAAKFGSSESNGTRNSVTYFGGDPYGSDEFLETRGGAKENMMPALGVDASALMKGRQALARIGRGVLTAALHHGMNEVDGQSFLHLIDDGEGNSLQDRRLGADAEHKQLGESLSNTPLRICRYAGPDGVAFGSHTDTTFLTMIPCTSSPGLEVLQPKSCRWVRPEAVNGMLPGVDIMILSGELLQTLGRGKFRAAVHRVVRPAGCTQARVSTPFLLRERSGALVPYHLLCSQTPRTAAQEHLQADVPMGRQGRITMTEISDALNGREGASHDTPLAVSSQESTTSVIRKKFEPYAANGVYVLNKDPLLVRISGFASRADCEKLKDEVSGTMSRSTTWVGSDAQDESNGLRCSNTTWIADERMPLLTWLTGKASNLSGLPSTFMEKWQVARYSPGGYFRLHTDHVEEFNDLCCGGRLGTLILYLSDDFAGGETAFPELDISVKPSTGDAIFFHNVRVPLRRSDANNMIADARSAHAGMPVQGGDKWIATKWLHPLPYPNGKEETETRKQQE